ncbi:hypothetical protein [Halorhabdus rudnickae]|uniref:hypothetical protein n=1 Tax=Halorhabdus rudnickae TaxID=1775544 RepID=UPI0010841707|nr:hypothetical protein [Halorhabdus rudnickae]
MSHVPAALEVVTGMVLSLLMFNAATTATYADEALIFGVVFVLGLFIAVHGLFRGIESAVATATAADETDAE